MKLVSFYANNDAFIGIKATVFGLALFTATTRTAFRFHSQKKLHLDDFVLMFACLALVASQILYYVKMKAFLGVEAIFLDPNPLNSFNDPEALYRQILTLQKVLFACFALTWTSIFAVKFCFLLFFYQIITRLQRFILSWKVTFGITIIFWAFCTSEVFISCPHFGLPALECVGGFASDSAFARAHALAIVSNILDILSDMLIISIPLTLLWEIKIKRQQKMLLGIFLCLSVFMIIIALIRISNINHRKSLDDITWQIFWLEMEAATAVIMVSITAFRSLLGVKALKAREKRERSWFSHRPKLLARSFKKTPQSESEFAQLPSIPGATLTGVRTFIHGNGTWEDPRAMGMTHKSEKDLSGADSHGPPRATRLKSPTNSQLNQTFDWT